MPPQTLKEQAFQSSATYLLGTSLISINQLQPHPRIRKVEKQAKLRVSGNLPEPHRGDLYINPYGG
jgi:hypothetical protein